MALVTVHRSPSSSTCSSPIHHVQQDAEPARARSRLLKRRESFFMVKGALLLLQEGKDDEKKESHDVMSEGTDEEREEKDDKKEDGKESKAEDQEDEKDINEGNETVTLAPTTLRRTRSARAQQQHLQAMLALLRPEDSMKLAVQLESSRPNRIRYLLAVSTNIYARSEETILLGVDFMDRLSNTCTIGMVLPIWSDTQVFLDGDGGFSVNTACQTRIFKPVSVQTMWSVLQVLHKSCEEAYNNYYIPGGSALSWASYYEKCIMSDKSCINEWKAMSDLESVRSEIPSMFTDQPTERELTERLIRKQLRQVMATRDLETVTSREIRTELEQEMNCNLQEYREFIDNEILIVLAQMDKPSKIFDHLYLGSEWNASNLDELQRNGVGYILNVTREIDNFYPEHFEYFNIRVYDEETTDLLQHWKDAYNFISRAKQNNSKALVHCKMGVSRSASTVVAYAMKEYSWTLEKAYKHVKERRSVVHPNPSFMKQLQIYEGILDASKQRHSSLWGIKKNTTQSESSSDSMEPLEQEQDQSLSPDETESHSPSSDNELPVNGGPEEDEVIAVTDEMAQSPPYCFRPLRQLSVLSETPSQDAEDSEGMPAICIQAVEEDALRETPHGLPADEISDLVEGHPVQELSHVSLDMPEPLSPRRQRINLTSLMRSISKMDSIDEDVFNSPPADGQKGENFNNNNSSTSATKVSILQQSAISGTECRILQSGFTEDKEITVPSSRSKGGPTRSPATRKKIQRSHQVLKHSKAIEETDFKRLPDLGGRKKAVLQGKGSGKILKKQKKIRGDKKLSKQLSFQPVPGLVKKQAKLMEEISSHPEVLEVNREPSECFSAESEMDKVTGSVEVSHAQDHELLSPTRPKLAHMKSILHLKKAGLVSKQTREIEISGCFPKALYEDTDSLPSSGAPWGSQLESCGEAWHGHGSIDPGRSEDSGFLHARVTVDKVIQGKNKIEPETTTDVTEVSSHLSIMTDQCKSNMSEGQNLQKQPYSAGQCELQTDNKDACAYGSPESFPPIIPCNNSAGSSLEFVQSRAVDDKKIGQVVKADKPTCSKDTNQEIPKQLQKLDITKD
ncbi:protein phosphatase Slingshot homolog 3-like [Protopterus annectens]|uniref:protein phosphatase Slingshot homolog 3-like n=1 Tax=Protopterus annectens TaxID=7888 RepID=UPI001CF97FD4|nr:protein phosphatase Slingshot homolog 3-like [Protopterus annectens]